MAELRWFAADRARLVLEYTRVHRDYPNFVLRVADDGLSWEGELADIPLGLRAEPLRVRLLYPKAYPIRPPRIVPLAPEIPSAQWGHEWHRWPSGAICIVEPRHWSLNYTAADALAKAADWYFNYLARIHGLIEVMPDVGRAAIRIEPAGDNG